jgi:predicted DNA-binding transcriptional regulator AlpA
MSRGPLVSPDRLKPDFGISIGNAQRKRLEADGRFPKRVPVTERSHAYVLGEIQAYVQARLAARDDQAA